MRPQRAHLVFTLAVLTAALLALPAAAAPPDQAGGPPEHAPAHGVEQDEEQDTDGASDAPGSSGEVRQDTEARRDTEASAKAKPQASAKAKPQASAKAKPQASAKAKPQSDARGKSAEVRQDDRAHERNEDQRGNRPQAPGSAAEGKPDKAAGDEDGEHAPAGNKGSVKVRSPGTAAHPPANQPHLGCVVQVDFYGFPGPGADMTFHTHAPTSPTGQVLTSASVSFTSEDANPRGNTLVGRLVVDLSDSLDGLTYHEQQGYHVKLTVEAEGPQGANTKHKVFWIDCAPTEEEDALGGGGDNEEEEEETLGGGSDSDDEGVLGTGGENDAADETDVRGREIARAETGAGTRPDGAVASAGGAADRSGRSPVGAVLAAGAALGQLAQTGIGAAAMLGLALLALGGGAAAVRAGRRRAR